MVMRTIRKEMRSHRESDLSVPQFRVMIYLNRNKGASLSDVADHLGLTLPAMSKMVGGLVDRNLVSRQINTGDRRYVILAPTELGRTLMREVYEPLGLVWPSDWQRFRHPSEPRSFER